MIFGKKQAPTPKKERGGVFCYGEKNQLYF